MFAPTSSNLWYFTVTLTQTCLLSNPYLNVTE